MMKLKKVKFVLSLSLILLLLSPSPLYSVVTDGYWLLIHTESMVPDDSISSDGSVEKYYDDTDGRIQFRKIKNLTVSNQNVREILEVEATWSKPPEVMVGDSLLSMNFTVKINTFEKVNTNYTGIDLWTHWTLPSVRIGTAGSDAALLDRNGTGTIRATVEDGKIVNQFVHKTLTKQIAPGKAGEQKVLNIAVNADGICGYRYTYEWTIGNPSARYSYDNLLSYLQDVQSRNDMKNTLMTDNQFVVNSVNGDYRSRTRNVSFEELQDCFHSDVSFYMILRGIMPTPKLFDDVPKTHWSSPYVTRASTYGLISGTGEGNYSPQKSVTRAQFVAMVVNVLGTKTSMNANQYYNDVNVGDWYYPIVNAAKETGLLGYFDAAEFKPNQNLTREEMSAILAEALSSENVIPLSSNEQISKAFSDYGMISPTLTEKIQRVYDLGLMGGKGQGKFDPKGLTTRAEAAAVQLKMMEALFGIIQINE